jgi:hypothetical protein
MRSFILLSGAVLALGIGTSIGSATQLRLAPRGSSEFVTKVASRNCLRDEKGWHYMDGSKRHDCKPDRPSGKDWAWRCDGPRCGWWHAKEKRWND